MEEIESEFSKNEFQRLTYSEQMAYLRRQVIEESDSEYEEFEQLEGYDSDDDWIPPKNFKPKLIAPTEELDPELSDVEDVWRDEDIAVEMNEETDSDDNDDEDISSGSVPDDKYVSKDGSIWNKEPPVTSQTKSHNILRQKPGPVKSTKTLSVRDTLKCILTDEMCEIIVTETNKKAEEVYNVWNEKNPQQTQRKWRRLNLREFDGYLGILITAGVRHSSSEHVRELWRSDSYPLFRATMSVNRFHDICRFIRFDDHETRAERLKTDKAAPISRLWSMMNRNLASKYVSGDVVTVDEQLFAYRGRTRFTQYNPKKPAKYGMKVWWVCDGRNSYPVYGQIYTGQSESGREKEQGARVVADLCYQFKGSGRNVTCDNFFTSLPLARQLMSWNLSMVGTLKKNKTCIPAEFKDDKREPLSSTFGFSEDGKVTLCSYVPKKKKNVVMLSTMHYNDNVSGAKNKPEIIHYYNSTKNGVDGMDKMVSHYTTKRRTLRWPVAMFYNMLDVSCLAAYIIYSENNPVTAKVTHSRRLFLQDLGKQMAMPSIETRAGIPQVIKHFSTKLAIESMLGGPIRTPQVSSIQPDDSNLRGPDGRLKVTGCCFMCRSVTHIQRKTRKSCQDCNRPICAEHTITISKCSSCTI